MYVKLKKGTPVRVRFPGGQPGEKNYAWINDKNHMAPGYPFTQAEASSYFPNLVPNTVWFEGEVVKVENGNAGDTTAGKSSEPSVQIGVKKACTKLRSVVPDTAVPSEEFECPEIDLSDFPGVSVG